HANEIREQAIASYDATDAISELEISAGTVDVTTTGAATGAADMTLTGATAVGLDTIGDISITNAASAHATLDLVTSDGDVTYTQTGAYNVLIDVVTADTTDDTVTITSAGAIYDDANDSTVDITAATITLSAGSDGVGQTNGTLDINATTALNVTTSGNGNITIEDLTGDLPVGTITAGSGTVALTSAGTIDDATSDTTTDITAANLALTAATGIGAGEGVETVVSIYAATTTAGDMNVDNAGTLSVGTVAGVTGARITAGGTSDDILIVTASPLTVDDAVLNAGGGNITLVADGTAASDKLTINNTITASGGNGNITLYAGEDINQNAFAVTAAGSGNINYYAGVDYNGGTPQAGLSTGLSDITMNGNSATATSDSGNITMTAPRNIVLGVVSTSGDVSMTADDSTYIASNSNGGITEVTSDAATNITAATATLRAATGIGSGDDLETKITALDALNSISGNINIEEIAAGGALGINRVTQSALGDILVQTADGILTVTAGQSGVSLTTGALTLSAGAGSNDDLVINAAIASTTGKVNLDATNDVIFGAAGDVTTTSGEIEVAATDAMITMVDGTVLDAGDDLIDLDADENIALGSLVTINDTATAIDINTANGAVTDANTTSVNITAASGEATIKAQTGVDVDTTLATIDVINDASGTININETDGLLINRIVQTTDGSIVVATAGATTVVAAGGGITTDASSATGDSISITVAGDSSLTVNDGVTVDNGTISLLADDDVIFGADGDMDAGVGGAGTDGDTITITADNDSDASGTGGAITLADGTLIDAGDGTIDLNADEDIALGGLITTDNTASAIAITSTSGAITDSGDAHTDIIADTGSAVVTIDAVTGVGSANALETTVATIDIDNNPATGASATGNIQIIELDTATGGLIIQKASQGDVGVDTANSGNIDISTVDGLINVTGAILARDGGTITIDANDANTDETLALTVGNTITSSVGLKDVGLGPVYAGNITLSADHDIDVNAKISTANANADYTANGDISLTTDSGQLGDVRIGNEIEVVYEGSIAVTADVDVDFDTVNGSLDTTETTAGADATITARTGNITETYDDSGAATVDIQANTITLNAVSGTIGQVADGTTIEIDSVLAVNADTSTGNGDITLREWAGNLLVDLITAGTGTVTLTAASAIEEEATGDVAADIVGATLDLTAGGAIGGTNALETTTADLTAHATATGDIVITETDGLLLRDLDTSDGDITIVSTTGNITIENAGVLATSGDVTIEATAGTINDAQTNTDTTTDITGNAVTLTAATGIGETADVDTAATTLDVSVTGTGVIVINEADAVELLDIDTADGSITITSAGAMTVTDVIAGGDTGSNDDVTLTTTSGDIIMSGDITALNDEVTLVSAANVTDTTSGATDISAANLTITANSGTVGAGGLNNELDTDVDTLTIAALGDTYVLEDSAITLTSIVTTNGLIDIEAGGTITTTTVTAGGVNGVTLYATAGNIFDTAGGLITAGADSSLKASGIIGTAVTTSYNPVNVDIDGDLWVWAGDQRNGVSVILEGYVNSSAETERVEIYEPSPPGLVMLDNRLMGGGNYGSGSVNGSILSRGYGETLIAKTDMFSLFYDRAVRPCGHKISTSWLPFEGYMIDNDFFKYGYRHPIDISQLDLKPLPAGFFINPEKAQYYIIRAK
ncbi:MAG: hypothetical protein ISS67_00930, partial [Desulfobacterales bacterium]|nr:hypothetical protein [Desulfobacterales bacterium]